MNEVCYLVFTPGKITVVHGRQDSQLPKEFYEFPLMRIDEAVCEVVLNELVLQDELMYEMIRVNIEQVIRILGAYGPVRVAFPTWDRMLIFSAVKPTENDMKCSDLDQLLDSFLSLRGPEIIL